MFQGFWVSFLKGFSKGKSWRHLLLLLFPDFGSWRSQGTSEVTEWNEMEEFKMEFKIEFNMKFNLKYLLSLVYLRSTKMSSCDSRPAAAWAATAAQRRECAQNKASQKSLSWEKTPFKTLHDVRFMEIYVHFEWVLNFQNGLRSEDGTQMSNTRGRLQRQSLS